MEDYKKRLLAEYYQVKERYNKLHKLLIKQEAGTLNFELSCPVSLLETQANLMGDYLKVLEIRMEIEKISVETDMEEENDWSGKIKRIHRYGLW